MIDDAALAAHTETALQRLITLFAEVSTDFYLTISLKDVNTTPTIATGGHTFEVVDKFAYLGSTISNNLSLDAQLNMKIGKAATAMARLAKRVLDSSMLTINTKMMVYKRAC
jgi:hypothetical protein